MASKKSHATEEDEAISVATEDEVITSIVVVEVHTEAATTTVVVLEEDEADPMALEVVVHAVRTNHKPHIPELLI